MDPLPSGEPDLVLKHLLHEAQVPGVHIVQQPESREYPKIRDSPPHTFLSAPKFLQPLPGKTQTGMKIPPPKLLGFGASRDLGEGEIPDFATGFWDSREFPAGKAPLTSFRGRRTNPRPRSIPPKAGRCPWEA